MTRNDIESGKLIGSVGIAPVQPAEFVILSLPQRSNEMSQTKAYGRFNFRVEFNGVTVGFSELTGLESAATSAGYRECSEPVHVQNVSGLRKFGNVTLKRGVIVEGPAQVLYKWINAVKNDSNGGRRARVTIFVVDEAGSAPTSFILSNAWPVKVEAAALNAPSNEFAIESLELAHEGVEVAG